MKIQKIWEIQQLIIPILLELKVKIVLRLKLMELTVSQPLITLVDFIMHLIVQMTLLSQH